MAEPAHRLWIEKQGAGVPVVFIHGLGGTGNVWEPQVRGLGEGFRTIRIDLSGSGRSPVSPLISFETWVDDIAEALDQDGIQETYLVGHCLGTQSSNICR